ncbi:MAG: PEP/pyruvate-binding domain-containing protein, partial [Planctomycetota bacterium]
QQAALGAIIKPWQPGIDEYGIQFVRQDPYTREEIAAMFDAVKASVICDPGVEAFYFPSYEQHEVAEDNRAWFEAQGIPISSTARWAEGNACYSQGWALGELKFFAADQITAAYASEQLLPRDILLTDAVPSEVPFVAGILSLSPSTPNSHVAILARTFGVPFAHLAVAEDANEAQLLVGRTILFSAGDDEGVGSVSLKNVTELLNAQEKAQILALKEPPDLDISPVASYGAYSADTNDLVPGDIQHFGGKAANYGILRRAIPDNCPPAAAISFDLWNDFLDQVIYNGHTLREEIDLRIGGYTYPPGNMASLAANLEYIREGLFKNTIATSFSVEQQDAIIAILQDPRYGFDANSKIRFRSSTNVEDSNQFSGAGLYDSFSGCLADDIDGDSSGPCICDPDESKERGVFRAIRKVFASFYNDNAFLERLRHGVNEADVGMALLVHHSFPDEFELANGVATLERRADDPNSYIRLVTQEGAVSVANPEDGSIPEEVSVLHRSEEEIELTHVRSSNLVILGETVLTWPEDYNDLSRLLVKAAREFERVTGKAEYILDFEYKKVAPGGAAVPTGGLVVKQIRQIPKSGEAIDATTPFLLSGSANYYTFQGEYGNIFENHRLKSQWNLETKSLWLTAENLENECFYANVEVEYAAEGQIRTLRGEMPLLPCAQHSFADKTASDGWSMYHLQNPRAYKLLTRAKSTVGHDESPIVTLSDFGRLKVEVNYARPAFSPYPWSITKEDIEIYRGPEAPSSVTQYSYSEDGISIRTSFRYDKPGGMIKTDPLASFIETRISGLTSGTIVLYGYFSQTFRPGHHNFTEGFLFEPRLELGISQSILTELKDKDVRLILLNIDHHGDGSRIETYGFGDEPLCPSDIDDDRDVDLTDFSKFGPCWDKSGCGECIGADLDRDGAVTGKDLLQFSLDWLEGK